MHMHIHIHTHTCTHTYVVTLLAGGGNYVNSIPVILAQYLDPWRYVPESGQGPQSALACDSLAASCGPHSPTAQPPEKK